MKLYYLTFHVEHADSVDSKHAFVVARNEFEAEDRLYEVEAVVAVNEITALAQAWDPSSNLPLLILPDVGH